MNAKAKNNSEFGGKQMKLINSLKIGVTLVTAILLLSAVMPFVTAQSHQLESQEI